MSIYPKLSLADRVTLLGLLQIEANRAPTVEVASKEVTRVLQELDVVMCRKDMLFLKNFGFTNEDIAHLSDLAPDHVMAWFEDCYVQGSFS